MRLWGVSAAIIALGAMLAAAPASAAAYSELGDTGELLGTAQSAVGATTINGTLDNLDGNDDIDLYKIYVTNPGAFSVTVSASLSRDNDAQLFLFDVNGALVLADDDGGPDVLPQFDAGELSGAAGFYYLGFNLFGTEPVFTGGALSGWNRDPAPFQTGSYTLSLTGVGPADVPEPATLGLLGLGILGIAGARRRKK